MTTTRALLAISVLSLLAAAVVALVSRTPADVRLDRAPADATDPSHGATFTESQVRRHGAYREASYAAFGASLVVEVATLLLLARGPLRSVLEAGQRLPGGWFTRTLLAAAFLALMTWVAQMPLAYVHGYVVQHAWDLSTQTVGPWFVDRLRSLLVGVVVALVGATAFFALVRWQPRTWWVWGWAGFTLLTALLFFLYPVVIAPLFNRFTALDDAALERDIRSLAAEAGVEVDDVLVADASRRSTVENAYVAGLGATKQVVLYDTLLTAGSPAETRYVVAHELGHQVENHILKNLVLSSVGLAVGFGALGLLARRSGLWRWAGADGIADPAVLPLLLVFATLAGLLVLPLQNVVSRAFEARADQIALDLTGDPDTAIRVHRRLAFSNIADLRPPAAAVWLLYSHPPVADRIEAAVAERAPAQ
ncbi:MAG: M48 family metallopeptidase [Actinomycetota bacterium]|nr:M48 family metallopeptidase [Actinomycetota bacterium]